jgi:predicted Fe-Mo cluster-binding NifX family protein
VSAPTPARQATTVRVAVATSTGERVDGHFATAAFFDVYDIDGNEIVRVGRRENLSGRCGCHDEHGGSAFEQIIGIIYDCRFIVALRIGNGAVSYLVDRGIRAAQIDDTVEGALQSLIKSGKLRTLLRRQERK